MPSIVCVDDDPLFQEIVACAAASIGASFVGLGTIAEAKERLSSTPSDVVVVDGLLPDGSGVNLVRWLRLELGFEGKIVFASAFYKDLRSFQKLRAVGADRILQKPIDTETLGRELASLVPQPVGLADARARVAVKLEQAAAKYQQGLVASAMELEGLGDRAHAGDANARAELGLRVHRIAGIAGSFGLPRVSELARALDNRLRAEDAIVECRPGLERLVHEMRRAASPHDGQGPQEQGPPVAWPWSILLITETPQLGLRYERELASQHVHLRTAVSVGDAVGALQRFFPDVLVFDGAGLTAGMSSPAMGGALAMLLDRIPVVMLRSGPPSRPSAAQAPGRATLEVARDAPAYQLLRQARKTFELPFSGRRVLVVDADPTTGRTLAEALGPLGIEVGTESDFSGFIRHLAKEPPHVLMLDVDLPGMGGLEICRLARADARFRDVPILCLSLEQGGERGIQAVRAGADELIIKSMAPAEIVARVTGRIKQGLMAEAWVASLLGHHRA